MSVICWLYVWYMLYSLMQTKNNINNLINNLLAEAFVFFYCKDLTLFLR